METPADPMPSAPLPSAPQVSKLPRRSGFSTLTAFETVIGVAILVATLFTLWTPANLFSSSLTQKMSLALMPAQATQAAFATPTPQLSPRIGIVAGHSGNGNDPGAVCSDGLTEASLNLKIATLVKQQLEKDGYTVDLLEEFDQRLVGYQAMALVSIHNDSCEYINDEATGFKVAATMNTAYPEKAERLTACLVDRYAKDTGLRFHANSITPDMTNYHAFSEINSNTIAAVIETGFLNLDRQVLTEKTDLVAKGVSDGLLCYIKNENVAPTATPTQP